MLTRTSFDRIDYDIHAIRYKKYEDSNSGSVEAHQMEKKRRHRSGYMHSITCEQYDTLLQFATGVFNVPVKQRTREQNTLRIRFHRHRKDFSVIDGKLFYRRKEVTAVDSASNIVKKQFHLNCGSGSRAISHQLKKRYANISETTIKDCLSKSKDYQKAYARFSNKSQPVPVIANCVNERWQMDLIDMNVNKVQYDGKVYKWILSVIDVFSRFVMLRPLTDKRSHGVKHELSKLIADHNEPKIIQCDQGLEFKGSVQSVLQKRGIKVIRSRAYHPQSQGKCESSHVGVRRKILFKMQQKTGFNWARDLHNIQEAINNVPKEVVAHQTPADVFVYRTSVSVQRKASRATLRCSKRMVLRHTRRKHNAVYQVGENILVRFPKTSHKNRVPRRRFVLEGTVLKRKVLHGLYFVRFTTPSGKVTSEWFRLDDVTSTTAEKEVKKRAKSKNTYQKLQQRQNHREKYLLTKTHHDNVEELLNENETIRILLDPHEDVGSCQFAAFADQLLRISVHRTALQMRIEAVQHIESFPDNYNSFIEGRIVEFIKSMKKPSTYGDHITLLALAAKYNVQVLVVSNQGPEHTVLVSESGIYDEVMPLLTLGYFPEGQGEHYISIAVHFDTMSILLYPYTSEGDRDQETPWSDKETVEGDQETVEGDQEAMEGDQETVVSDQETVEGDQETVEGDQETVVSDQETVEGDQEPVVSDLEMVEGDQETVEGDEAEECMDYEEREFLSRELQRQIILICVQEDPSFRFTLRCVNLFFMTVIQEVPPPNLHIGEQVLADVPYPVSLRRLYMAAGQGSGLAIALRTIFNNRRWWNTWLYLNQSLHRNFELRGVCYRWRQSH